MFPVNLIAFYSRLSIQNFTHLIEPQGYDIEYKGGKLVGYLPYGAEEQEPSSLCFIVVNSIRKIHDLFKAYKHHEEKQKLWCFSE